MGLLQSILHLDWKNFNLFEVIGGCADYYLIDFQDERKKEQVERVSKYRLKICDTCHMNENQWCNNTGTKLIQHVQTKQMVKGCGCNLNCKTALLSSSCPAAKWKPVTTSY